ncbi:hypothetical protein DESUT3_19590 [Desulfuromonas versatilis]|uniref:Uroporphyrinogen-III synthase n=1 Tax=Desulfuromonas versatilis TaxID=2802975 RepID=A0ABM8HPJ3_9BACT|nr:uroporphyrinogen-III synthase [Desulfuromonas versatilis]BCR04890.1 hypothetical protein DESUT3_19590 [Desulfuromonas versatilis]
MNEQSNLSAEVGPCHDLPLFGKTFLVTRAIEQAGEIVTILKSHGGLVLGCPTIRIVQAKCYAEPDSALANIGSFDWVIFTSQNTVVHFFNRLAALGCDTRALCTCRFCAVGPVTAEMLHARGVAVHMVPDKYTAEGIVEAFSGLRERRGRVLLPRGDRARSVISEGLTRQGYEVIAPILYYNVTPDGIPDQAMTALSKQQVDCIAFTAPSAVINLAKILGKTQFYGFLKGVTVAAIGPITSQACDKIALKPSIEAPKYTLASLADEIVNHYRRERAS